ncbi:MAG: type II toxin-antitoxin system MqsA family antitoxin [Deltaproteobacteria bacterium]|nr:type II toxin-antitoxin system MqsA family antitoxin [Deltaproteobacteria bacterium]
MTSPVCPETGTPMTRDSRPMTLRYEDATVTFDMPGWYCSECGESIHTREDMKVSDRQLNLLKARSEGLLEPAEIRRIRTKRLHLSQELAGEVIGGGPRAFQKYESGDALPSRAISSALMLLDHDPKGLEILRARQRRTDRAFPRRLRSKTQVARNAASQ